MYFPYPLLVLRFPACLLKCIGFQYFGIFHLFSSIVSFGYITHLYILLQRFFSLTNLDVCLYNKNINCFFKVFCKSGSLKKMLKNSFNAKYCSKNKKLDLTKVLFNIIKIIFELLNKKKDTQNCKSSKFIKD